MNQVSQQIFWRTCLLKNLNNKKIPTFKSRYFFESIINVENKRSNLIIFVSTLFYRQ